MGVRQKLLDIKNMINDKDFFGNVWFVDSVNGNDTYSGYDWAHAKATIGSAITAASAGDKIIVSGEPTETVTLEVDKQLIIEGLNIDNNAYPSMIYTAGDYPIFTVTANNVVIRNLGIVQNSAHPAISIGDGSAVYKLVIENCKFDLYATGTYGISSTSTEDAPDITIKNCLFRSFATAGILANWTRAKIEKCRFIVGTALSGIVHSPDTGSRPDTHILDCKFITTDSTNGVGITVTNTPTAGMLFVDGCTFANFADDDHCCSKRTGYVGLNWNGITGLSITT